MADISTEEGWTFGNLPIVLLSFLMIFASESLISFLAVSHFSLTQWAGTNLVTPLPGRQEALWCYGIMPPSAFRSRMLRIDTGLERFLKSWFAK